MPQNRKNKGMQTAFQKVLDRYENGAGSRYICHRLESLYYSGSIGCLQERNCKKVIDSQLQGFSSLESWLINSDHASSYEIWDKEGSGQKMKQTRINWLKHLISQCKKNKF